MPEGAPGINIDESLGGVTGTIEEVVDKLLHLVLVLAVPSQLVQDQVQAGLLVVPIKGVGLLILHVELVPQLFSPGHVGGIASGLGQPCSAPDELIVESRPGAEKE